MILDILYLLYFMFYFPVLVLRGRWHKGFAARFGFLPASLVQDLAAGKNIWVHAVSVGEVGAVEEVVRGLRSRYPDGRVVLSVTTKAGHAFARSKYPVGVTVIWAPLDLSRVVRRYVAVIRPLVYVAVETELWPHLFESLAQAAVPVVIINARISDKAYPRYRAARLWIRPMLRMVALVCAQSALDAERFIALGAGQDRVKVVGNVKFDVASPLPGFDMPASRRAFGVGSHDTVWVGASTHPGEEAVILDAFTALRARFPRLRLVLAPRHPQRAAGVCRVVKAQGHLPVLLTRLEGRTLGADDVLVIDAIGHLMQLYRVADVVFMGKSLGLPRRGGQNPIEPAACGKPVIVGPFMENFRDVIRLFRMAGAVVELGQARGLCGAVEDILTHPDKAAGLSARARVVVDQNRGAAQRTVDMIAGLAFRRWA